MVPRIAVNARFRYRAMSGVERYARQITEILGQKIRLLAPQCSLQGVLGHLWEQFALPLLLHPQEILWSPANTGPLVVSRQVLTLHDISFLEHPDWYSRSFTVWYRWMIPRLVGRTRALITDSSFSKERIRAAFHVNEEKIHVVPCGVDAGVFFPRDADEIDRVRARFHLARPYMLTVGSPSRRKNIAHLMKIWSRQEEDHRGIELVVVGSSNPRLRSVPQFAWPENFHWLQGVNDCDLAALYSGAQAAIFPSQAEGFGLPLLEAMACRTPVLAADSGAYPEVIGNAGILFNPWKSDRLVDCIQALHRDAALRERLAESGFERSRLFSWENSAAGIYEVLENA